MTVWQYLDLYFILAVPATALLVWNFEGKSKELSPKTDDKDVGFFIMLGTFWPAFFTLMLIKEIGIIFKRCVVFVFKQIEKLEDLWKKKHEKSQNP